MNSIKYLICFSGIVYFFSACSPYDKRPVALFYHNLTSKYNGYYLGRERMMELETELFKAEKNNYNRVLNIYPKIDSNYSKGVKDRLDKIIKNVSLPIQWHKTSHWVDDCYIVIGKCRYYDVDWENAMTTFKFINKRYEDNDVKNHSSIWQMRVLMQQNQMDEAREMGDDLEEEFLNLANVGRLSLANGHYYIKEKDYANAYEKLKIGVKYIKPKDYRSKVYYILGQLGQKLGKDSSAFAFYKKCSRMRPEYEMYFHAKLNMYQMKELKGDKDAKKTLKYYRKLLTDIKNKEYDDKIYYEIATFHQKRESLDSAIANYKKSARSGKNTFTKSFAYLRMAEIYYDNKRDFEKSSTYYDSTITIIEKDLPEYPKAKRRQRILKEFVEQLKIVRLEDSLQKLAKLDSASLNKLIDKWIAADEKKAKDEFDRKENELADKEQQARMDELKASMGITDPTALAIDGNSKWYFYNPVTLENGKAEFSRKWNNRPNEDNWRRSNKERSDEDLSASNSNSAKDVKGIGEKPEFSFSPDKMKYLENIPISGIKLDSSNARLKRSLFRLSQIYNYNLEEYSNAQKTYDRFIDEYPNEEKVPEALYANYLICKNKLADSLCEENYKYRLLNTFPKSLYAKLIINPNYLVENQLLGEKIKYLYRSSYEMYERDNYLGAQNAVAQIMTEYPDNEFEDRFVLLRAMILGQTQSIKTYKDSLQAFVTRYERTSKLIPYAKNLIAGSDKVFKTDSVRFTQNRIVYDLDLKFQHYYCIVATNKEILNAIVEKYKAYNLEYYSDQKLTVSTMSINETTFVIVVKGFPNDIQVMNYYEKQKGKSAPIREFEGANQFEYFVITEPNFTKLTQAKSHTSYFEFFKRNYLRQ
ncbi:MAG: hypothetical protein ACKVOU_08225 [Cytophagales bacterium]